MYKDKKGLYRQSVTINGKRKVFSAKTKKDLILKIATFKNEAKYHTPRFKDVADEWEEYIQDKISHGSWRSYKAPLHELVSVFGDRELGDITPNEVQHYLNSLDLSFKSITTRKSVMGMVYDYARINADLDVKNPCENIKVDSRKRRSHRNALTLEEIEKVKSTTKDSFILAPLILFTGMRCGEALALTYDCIDWKKKQIRINKSIDHYGNRPVISSTKTEAGNRIVPLLPQLEALLDKKAPPSDYVVSGSEPLTKSALRCRWNKWKKEYDIDVDRHQIRHSYASILYSAGIDPKSAQKLLGHANFATTMDIYTHLSEEHVTEAYNKLNDLLRK